MLTLLVLELVDPMGLARWEGLKGIIFLGRPYKQPKIKVVPPTFISLPYTMTPFPTLLFNSQITNPNFFFRLKMDIPLVDLQ